MGQILYKLYLYSSVHLYRFFYLSKTLETEMCTMLWLLKGHPSRKSKLGFPSCFLGNPLGSLEVTERGGAESHCSFTAKVKRVFSLPLVWFLRYCFWLRGCLAYRGMGSVGELSGTILWWCALVSPVCLHSLDPCSFLCKLWVRHGTLCKSRQ